MSDGFIGRWSKRKLEVKEGKAVEEEPAVEAAAPPPLPEASSRLPPPGEGRDGGTLEPQQPPPPPTLADTELLTPQSDFTRFVARDVAPDVKNAAMKKLFADPRFNVMDRLDTYIDDYSQPDPMPESMLRELVAGKFLKLFETTEEGEGAAAQAAPRDDANNPAGEVVAQSHACNPLPGSTDNADPDLRLQQDDAAPGEDPGRGAA